MSACQRCGGKGELPQFRHVQNGVCFRCGGNGAEPNGEPQDGLQKARDEYRKWLDKALALGLSKEDVRAYLKESLRNVPEEDDAPFHVHCLEAIMALVIQEEVIQEDAAQEDYGPSLHDAMSRDNELAFAMHDDHCEP